MLANNFTESKGHKSSSLDVDLLKLVQPPFLRSCTKGPSVHDLLKKHADKHTNPISSTAWQDHVHKAFRQPPINIPARQWSGTLSGQGLYNSRLHGIVAKHVSRTSSTSLPGFVSNVLSFLKHACKLVKREDGRGFHHMNVLTPHVSKTFYSEPPLLPVSRTIYRLCANVLRTLSQHWTQHFAASIHTETSLACCTNLQAPWLLTPFHSLH
eukprot:1160805-Pelagomonas_calceolata.AAC.7